VERGECWNVTEMERSIADVESVLFGVNRPRSVDVSTFSGPLVLVVVGLAVSVVIACAEIVYYRQRGRVSTPLLKCPRLSTDISWRVVRILTGTGSVYVRLYL